MVATVYLMAQGVGSRWHDRRAPRPAVFETDAPPYKHLLDVAGEPLIHRSARFFQEAGFHVVVVAGTELHSLGASEFERLTLPDPGEEVLTACLAAMEMRPADGQAVIALGDALFSRAAVASVAANLAGPSVLARVDPSPVCNKVAPEVFAAWWPAALEARTRERIGIMVGHRGHPGSRPSKPWGLPFAVLDDFPKMWTAYSHSLRLDAVRDLLIVSSDYTDDIDSPEEWFAFWPDIRAAAIEESPP